MPIHTKLSFFFAIITMLVMFPIASNYWNDPDATSSYVARFALLLGIFAALFPLPDLIRSGEIRIAFKPLPLIDDPLMGGARIIIPTIMVFLVQVGLKSSVGKLAISSTELFLYFVFAAVGEEIVFRGIIMTLVMRLTGKVSVSAVVSGSVFCLAHLAAYGRDPAMLLTTLIAGIIFATFYSTWWKDGHFVYDPDITTTMIAHLIVNFIAALSIMVIV